MAAVGPSETVKNITDDIKLIAQTEIELAKAEVMPKVKSAGLGAGLLGGAGYFALNAASLLYVAASLGVGILFMGFFQVVPALALGFTAVAVLMLLIAGILALIGKGKLQAMKDPQPKLAIAQAQGVVEDVKGAVHRGKDGVPASITARPRDVIAVTDRQPPAAPPPATPPTV